jgi:DNA-binding CsgD family transcriptional regulator
VQKGGPLIFCIVLMNIEEIQRICAESDYKSLSLLEKAVKLSLKKKSSQRNIADALGIKRKQVRNALKAHKEKRELGRNGRLPALFKDNEKLIR